MCNKRQLIEGQIIQVRELYSTGEWSIKRLAKKFVASSQKGCERNR